MQSVKNINIKNRRASFDYEIVETMQAGLVLTGTEIKSIREGKAGLTDTYCVVQNGEVWVKNMYIAEYFFGSYNNHSTHRDRKLLLNRKEIRQLVKISEQPSMTIVPLKLYITEQGYAKLLIGVGSGKKAYDKRQSIRERDDKRMIDRMMKK